jgi:hypothetical protein
MLREICDKIKTIMMLNSGKPIKLQELCTRIIQNAEHISSVLSLGIL